VPLSPERSPWRSPQGRLRGRDAFFNDPRSGTVHVSVRCICRRQPRGL
jgi:hypothetical protein